MLATLLPARIAPIIRSRVSTRRLTRRARAFPFFSSCSIRARENPVSAVSLAEKKNDTAKQKTMMAREIQSSVNIAWSTLLGELFLNEGSHLGGLDVGRDEGATNASNQDEGQLASLDLLVLADQIHQPVRIRQAPGHL